MHVQRTLTSVHAVTRKAEDEAFGALTEAVRDLMCIVESRQRAGWRAYLTHDSTNMPEEATHASNDDVEHDSHPLDDESDDDEGGGVIYNAPLKGDIKPTHYDHMSYCMPTTTLIKTVFMAKSDGVL